MKLNRDDWTTAAMRVMLEKGVIAVKVEALARDLKVSKGSFYWHFKNRTDLLEAVLTRWETDTEWLIEQAKQADTPQDKLLRLFTLIGQMTTQGAGLAVDSAIFFWAQSDAEVLERVQSVEKSGFAFYPTLSKKQDLRKQKLNSAQNSAI